MAVAARKVSHESHTRRRTPLQLVRPASRRRTSTRAVAKCKSTYIACVIVMIALTIAGLGRVALSVKATQTSFEKGVLARDIKAVRLEGDLLEVDRSALMTPSRIELIAGSSMEMAAAGDVSYLELPAGTGDSEQADSEAGVESAVSTSATPPAKGLFQAVMDMAAGEAHVLLVGDAGLASSR